MRYTLSSISMVLAMMWFVEALPAQSGAGGGAAGGGAAGGGAAAGAGTAGGAAQAGAGQAAAGQAGVGQAGAQAGVGQGAAGQIGAAGQAGAAGQTGIGADVAGQPGIAQEMANQPGVAQGLRNQAGAAQGLRDRAGVGATRDGFGTTTDVQPGMQPGSRFGADSRLNDQQFNNQQFNNQFDGRAQAGAGAQGRIDPLALGQRDDPLNPVARWRFVQHRGDWWYWTPSESWMYFRDGRWQHYDRRTFARRGGAMGADQDRIRTGFRGTDTRAYDGDAADTRRNMDPRWNDPSFRRGANFGDAADAAPGGAVRGNAGAGLRGESGAATAGGVESAVRGSGQAGANAGVDAGADASEGGAAAGAAAEGAAGGPNQ